MINYEKKNGLRVLFVLGGLAMGGVETYIVRLVKELSRRGNRVEVLLLSGKFDSKLMHDISMYSSVSIFENADFFAASSWVNSFLPLRMRLSKIECDIVHVVDLITLGFVFFNKDIKFRSLSIGIYHQKELTWWRGKSVYFRRKLIELYDKNISLTLFPNESLAKLAGDLAAVPLQNQEILPLGIDLTKYEGCKPSRKSLRIVSIGRLVDFKVYNKHFIGELANIRNLGNFEYFIYGQGPEEQFLKDLAIEKGVSRFVHFMGEVSYEDLPMVFNESFCFIGSGTTIIEAAAAGIPGLVGIESIKNSRTCGLFSDVVGYSYNEELATTRRITFYEALQSLDAMSASDYSAVSDKHREKAREFDLRETAEKFLSLSCKYPDFDFSFNRWVGLISFFYSIARFGRSALKNRFDH